MPQTKFNEEITKFNQKYKTDITIENFGIHLRKLKYLDNFLFESKTNTPQKDYLKLASHYYARIIDDSISINNDGSYQPITFSFIDYVKDFEKLSEAQYNFEHQNKVDIPERPKYFGMELKKVLSSVVKMARQINKSLTETWKIQFINEKITLDNLKTLNNKSTVILDGLNSNYDFENPKNSEQKEALKNFSAVYDTMSKIREERGFFWKLFHPIKNNKENNFFMELKAKKSSYLEKQFPIDNTIQSINDDKILTKQAEELKIYKGKIEITDLVFKGMLKLEKENIKPDLVDIDSELEKENITEQEKEIKKEIFNLFKPYLNKNSYTHFAHHANRFVSLGDRFCKSINSAYDSYTKGDISKEDLDNSIRQNNIELFENIAGYAKNALSSNYENNLKLQAKIGQKLVDLLMNKMSVVGEKEELKQYGNGYIILNEPNVVRDQIYKTTYYNEENTYKIPENDANKQIEELKDDFTKINSQNSYKQNINIKEAVDELYKEDNNHIIDEYNHKEIDPLANKK